MLYVDFNWFLTPNIMIPDEEINTDKLEWVEGDYWVVVKDANGKRFLRKIDPLFKFLKDGIDAKNNNKA